VDDGTDIAGVYPVLEGLNVVNPEHRQAATDSHITPSELVDRESAGKLLSSPLDHRRHLLLLFSQKLILIYRPPCGKKPR